MKKFIYGEPKPKFDDVDVPVIWRWVDAAEVYASDSDSAADPEADNENDRTLRSRRHQGVSTDVPLENEAPHQNCDEAEDRPTEDKAKNESSTEITAVTFKCLGAARQEAHQRTLEMAREILFSGQKVSVRLVEEPENAMDRNAISFHVKIGKAWNRIGYVARELTNYVKRAIDAGEIAGVEVKWIRYRYWPGGCGFYAGISVSRRGQWEYDVIKKSSY